MGEADVACGYDLLCVQGRSGEAHNSALVQYREGFFGSNVDVQTGGCAYLPYADGYATKESDADSADGLCGDVDRVFGEGSGAEYGESGAERADE